MLGLLKIHNPPPRGTLLLDAFPSHSINTDMRLGDCETEHIKKEGKTWQEIRNGRL
jgi:hypothetical protein